MLQTKQIAILHCYGLPGSGKSEIVRMLAKKFPFVNESSTVSSKSVIKCHIQCKDSGDDINTQLKELVKKLEAYLDKNMFQNIQKDIDNGFSNSLVQTFVKLSHPVVLVIEDPDSKIYSQSNTKKLFKNLLSDVAECTKSNPQSKIHIYVTSHTNSLMDSEESSQILSNNNVFIKKHVQGFNEKEAIKYLCFSKTDWDIDKVAETFQDLPIKLKRTKIYYIDVDRELPMYIQFEFNISNGEHASTIEKEFHEKIVTDNEKNLKISKHFSGQISKFCPRCIDKTISCENVLKLVFEYNEVQHKKDYQKTSKEVLASFSEKASVVQQLFSGLPLGLHAAKLFCQDKRFDYVEYLDYWKKFEKDIVEDEKTAIKKEFGESAEHVFQAINMIFLQPNESDNNSADLLDWKVLSSLSYFNYDRIPEFSIQYCFQVLRETEVDYLMNKKDTGALITKLLKYNLCSKTSNDEITFHVVVSRAFMFHQQSNAIALQKAIEIMCGLVSKDMRRKQHCKKMCQLRRHIQILLSHINKNEKKLFDKKKGNTLLLKALVSYLYETAAAIMIHESPRLFLKKSQRYFRTSLKYVWEEELLEQSGQLKYEFVKSIIEKSKEKARMLPNDFTLDFASKVFFHKEEMEFLKSKASECFEGIDITNPIISHKKLLLQKLRSKDFFLSNEQYSLFFYAERLASILHSWSRLGLYAVPDDCSLGIDCKWMSLLSARITTECRKMHKVRLLTEYLSQAGGLIPIVLHDKNRKKKELETALSFCESALERKETVEKVYENGLVKEMYGSLPIYKRIFVLKCIVRLSTRLIELAVQPDKADDYCKELLELSLENAQKITSCPSCIIYCAKYYFKKDLCCNKKNHKSSLYCFQQYFDLSVKTNYEPKFSELCWSTYNYAKVVYHLSQAIEIRNVVEMCEIFLNNKKEVSQHSTEDLKTYLRLLRNWLPKSET